jgi:hypothetical protein
MKQVYRVLAFAVAAMIVVQAAAIAFAVFGLFAWVDAGNTLDSATGGSGAAFGGAAAFTVHALGGVAVTPILALLLLVSSFFAKVPGGLKWALIVFGTTVVQVALGILAHEVAILGLFHGGLALILFGLAISAAMRVKTTAAVQPAVSVPAS